MAIGNGRGCRLKATWERIFGRSIVASIPQKIRAIWASNQPPKRPRFPPRLTTISARSGFDRASIVLLKLHRSASARAGSIPRHNVCDRGSIAPRSRLDRAAITARSRRDRGSIARFFLVISAPSDGDPPVLIANNRGRQMHLTPLI